MRSRHSASAASTSPISEALVQELNAALRPGTTVLVKGSRFMRMERVVERVIERLGEPSELAEGDR